MTLYKIWCEWDMGFNEGDEGVYKSEEERLQALKNVNWEVVDIRNWEQAEDMGFLELYEEQI